MSNIPNDDLFKESTMSFGEHLEELRVSLFRSMFGLVLGTVVALLIAHHIVHAIQGPLKDALDRFYLDKAVDDMMDEYKAKEKDSAPPETLALIREEGLIPSKTEFDVAQLVTALKIADPAQFGDLKFTPHRFLEADFEDDFDGHQAGKKKIRGMATLLQKSGAASGESPGKLLWSLLSIKQRQTVESIADKDEITDSDRAEMVAILSDLLSKPQIPDSDEFSGLDGSISKPIETYNPVAWLNSLFEGEDKYKESLVSTVKKLRQRVSEADEDGASGNSDDLRRLNRLLFAAAFPDFIRPPRQVVVDVPTWKPTEIRVQTLNAQEAFMIWLKAALISGFVMTSPWIFWQIWTFVAVGLYPHEKKYVHIYLPFSLVLFLCGTCLAFFFVFEPVLDFLFQFNKLLDIDPDPRISEWLSFVLFLPLGFGIAFQLPLVMLFLNRIGVFSVEQYLEKWRIAILVIFVISMVLTPADPISMLLMAIPLTVLYFLGIALCRWMPRGRNPFDEAYEP